MIDPPAGHGERSGSLQFWVQDVGSSNPRTLFWAVPLPIYQILQIPSATSGFEEPTDSVVWIPINESDRLEGAPMDSD